MPRYKLTIEYDGTAYNGFQAQDFPSSLVFQAVPELSAALEKAG